jgi:AcrR family transcriptional regulator
MVDPVKHEEKRRQILGAAERCFVRDGFRGASISEICAEAGISPGHLYHYFPSKEAILEAMTEAGLAYAAARLDEMMQSANVLEAMLAEMECPKPRREHKPHALLLEMVSEGGRNPAIGNILHKHSRALHSMLAKFLRKGQERTDRFDARCGNDRGHPHRRDRWLEAHEHPGSVDRRGQELPGPEDPDDALPDPGRHPAPDEEGPGEEAKEEELTARSAPWRRQPRRRHFLPVVAPGQSPRLVSHFPTDCRVSPL